MRALAAALVVLICCWPRAWAWAADLSGVWELDQAAWQQEVDELVAKMVAQLPPEAIEGMKRNGVDPAATLKDSATNNMAGTVEFLPDGKVRTTTAEEGTTEDSRWQLDGDELRIDAPDAGVLTGRVEGERIVLHPVIDESDPNAAMLRDLAFQLVRRP